MRGTDYTHGLSAGVFSCLRYFGVQTLWLSFRVDPTMLNKRKYKIVI